jgi:choline-glycine betaine transporter
MKNVKASVFWPPFLLLIAAMGLCFYDLKTFQYVVNTANTWLIGNFTWLFTSSALAMVCTIVWAYFSQLGDVTIGGEGAECKVTRWEWFSITLCTTVATGILFWATAEPIFHVYSPPESLGLKASSGPAVIYAMSTMFLHWSFTPYCIYGVAGLAFALAHYNLDKPYSIGSMLSPIFGSRMEGGLGRAVDSIALLTLVLGMAASMGGGILSIAGGLTDHWGIPRSIWIDGLIALAIGVSFILSASTGLKKGIAFLSNANTQIFFGFAIFVFLLGPTTSMLGIGVEGLGQYFGEFFQKSLFTGASSGDKWPQYWSVFYWCNWLAWAPVTALFLGSLGKGYTVREFIKMTILLPSVFAIIWMTIFSGTILSFDLSDPGAFKVVLDSKGAEAMVYALLDKLPLSAIMAAIFMFTVFISYVAGADANTEAMACLCEGKSANDPTPSSTLLKAIWGALICIVSWVMISFAGGVDGIKILGNLGGLPALFIIGGSMLSLFKMKEMLTGAPVAAHEHGKDESPVPFESEFAK